MRSDAGVGHGSAGHRPWVFPAAWSELPQLLLLSPALSISFLPIDMLWRFELLSLLLYRLLQPSSTQQAALGRAPTDCDAVCAADPLSFFNAI